MEKRFTVEASFASETAELDDEIRRKAESLAEEGKTPLFFIKDKNILGMIAVADVIREDSPAAVKELQDMGIRVVMITGDNRRTAEAVGKQAGVDQVIAQVLPDGKEAAIRELQKYGKVAMVGDGINDAPGAYKSRYRYHDRSRHGCRDRCGRRGADEQQSERCACSGAPQQTDAQEHTSEPVLGVHIQRYRDTARGRSVDTSSGMAAQPDVRRGSNEPVQFLRSDKRTHAESV